MQYVSVAIAVAGVIAALGMMVGPTFLAAASKYIRSHTPAVSLVTTPLSGAAAVQAAVNVPALRETAVSADVKALAQASATERPLAALPYKWGTYRPGVYFGVRARHPSSPLFGLMWFDPYQFNPLEMIRHEARAEERASRLEWPIHDGRHYGIQSIADGPYNITVEFVQDPTQTDSFYANVRVGLLPLVPGTEAHKLYQLPFGAEPRNAVRKTPLHDKHPPTLSLLWYWVLPDESDDILLPELDAQPTARAAVPVGSGTPPLPARAHPGFPLSAPLTSRLVLPSAGRSFDFTARRVTGTPAQHIDPAALPAAADAYVARVAATPAGERARNPIYTPAPSGGYGFRPPVRPENRFKYARAPFQAPTSPAGEFRFTSYRTPRDPWRVHDSVSGVLGHALSDVGAPAFDELRKMTEKLGAIEDRWDADVATAAGPGARAAAPHGNIPVHRGMVNELGSFLPQLDNTLRSRPPQARPWMGSMHAPVGAEPHDYAPKVPGSSRVTVYQATLQLPFEVDFSLSPTTSTVKPRAAAQTAAEAAAAAAPAYTALAQTPAVAVARRNASAAFCVPRSAEHSEFATRAPALRAAAQERFHRRFEDEFGLARKGFNSSQVGFAHMALSSLLGGLGYWHGSGRNMQRVGSVATTKEVDAAFQGYYADVSAGKFMPPHRISSLERSRDMEQKTLQTRNYRSLSAPTQELFSCSPSRICFPRGFLWDEGFHQLLVSRWDPALSQEVFRTWAALIDSEGWLPREQILDDEARTRVPEEFQTQRSDIANPPTQILALRTMLAHMLQMEGKRLGCALTLAGSLQDAIDACARSKAPADAAAGQGAARKAGDHSSSAQINFSPEFTGFVRFLREILPSYRRQVLWYLHTQAAPAAADPAATGVSYDRLAEATKTVPAGQKPSDVVAATIAAAAGGSASPASAKPDAVLQVPDDLPYTLARDKSWVNASVYMWHTRTRTHALSSGLDDYPRLPVGPSPFVLAEGHVDLQAWLIMATNTMADLSETLLDLASITHDTDATPAAGSPAPATPASGEPVRAPSELRVGTQFFPVSESARRLSFPPGTTPQARDFYTSLVMHEEAAAKDISQTQLSRLPPLIPAPRAVPKLDLAVLERDIVFFRSKAAALLQTMNRLMYDEKAGKYADFALISGNYNAQEQNIHERFIRKFGVKDRSTEVKPGHMFIHHDGYVSLMPLFLNLVPVESNSTAVPSRLNFLLDTLSSPHLMTDFGIRSLSKADPLFGSGENYWRGNVWMPINVLALQGLSAYADATSGEMRAKVLALRQRLRDGIINNLHKEYRRQGFLFENYEAVTGQGARCNVFTGWSALVVLMMDGSV
jgi:hypothetical protein